MSVNINELLDEAAKATCLFLGSKLPSLTAEDWWDRRVIQFLSPAQRDAVERHSITHLSQLDLAALLNTLDNNWRSLDEDCQFPPGSLNFVREMRTVRNRWSHRSAAPEYVADDIYRDLDTLERFLSIISADSGVLTIVREERLAAASEVLKSHSRSVHSNIEPAEQSVEQTQIPEESSADPLCPVCGNEMVLRTARTGPYAGNEFWGCSEWSVTGCNGIINVPKQQDPGPQVPPACPNCQSSMIIRTARTGPYAGNQFWGCSEWGVTGCGGIRNIDPPKSQTHDTQHSDVDDLPF